MANPEYERASMKIDKAFETPHLKYLYLKRLLQEHRELTVLFRVPRFHYGRGLIVTCKMQVQGILVMPAVAASLQPRILNNLAFSSFSTSIAHLLISISYLLKSSDFLSRARQTHSEELCNASNCPFTSLSLVVSYSQPQLY
jgi:hypothetical protein